MAKSLSCCSHPLIRESLSADVQLPDSHDEMTHDLLSNFWRWRVSLTLLSYLVGVNKKWWQPPGKDPARKTTLNLSKWTNWAEPKFLLLQLRWLDLSALSLSLQATWAPGPHHIPRRGMRSGHWPLQKIILLRKPLSLPCYMGWAISHGTLSCPGVKTCIINIFNFVSRF